MAARTSLHSPGLLSAGCSMCFSSGQSLNVEVIYVMSGYIKERSMLPTHFLLSSSLGAGMQMW